MSDAKSIQDFEETGKPSVLSPFTILGYVLGGLSLLNLVREFKLVKLYGLVKDWGDAFSYFIFGVRDFLFGWIKLSWLTITNLESYFLVVVFLLISSYMRALVTGFTLKSEKYSEETPYSKNFVMLGTIVTGAFFYTALFFFFAITALLLPQFLTLGLFSILIVGITLFILFPTNSSNMKAILRTKINLMGSIVVFLLLVAINYGLKS